jgi:hypothetical protein
LCKYVMQKKLVQNGSDHFYRQILS